jgi:hypothetical protein
VSSDGRTLALRLFGGVCDATWGGLETEADGAVVIGGWEVDPHPDAPCAAVGILLATTVRLPAPVGDRVIIDVWTGCPCLRRVPLPCGRAARALSGRPARGSRSPPAGGGPGGSGEDGGEVGRCSLDGRSCVRAAIPGPAGAGGATLARLRSLGGTNGFGILTAVRSIVSRVPAGMRGSRPTASRMSSS